MDFHFQIIIPLRCAVQLSDSSSEDSSGDENIEDTQTVQNEISKERVFLDQLSAIQVWLDYCKSMSESHSATWK